MFFSPNYFVYFLLKLLVVSIVFVREEEKVFYFLSSQLVQTNLLIRRVFLLLFTIVPLWASVCLLKLFFL